MQKTENYGLNKPEVTDFYNVEDFNSNMDVIDTKMKELESAGGKSQALEDHVNDKENPHGVTKSQVGLSNVPNVSTNNQTPTYTVPTEASNLESGEKLSAAMGKIAKFMKDGLNVISGTLAAGETTITLTDESITEDSTFSNLCTTIWGVNPVEAPVVANGSITYTFEAQDVDMGVKVRCF